jgi:hypothetical protein
MTSLESFETGSHKKSGVTKASRKARWRAPALLNLAPANMSELGLRGNVMIHDNMMDHSLLMMASL